MMSAGTMQYREAPRMTHHFGGLEIGIIVMGSFGMLIWGSSIGFSLGYCIYVGKTLIGTYVLIPASFGQMYVTCRIIFLITDGTFRTSHGLADLHKNVGRLLAFTILGFSVWVTSVVWYVQEHRFDPDGSFTALFSCCFAYLFGVILTALVGALRAKMNSGGAIANEIPLSPAHHAPGQSFTNHAYAYNQHASSPSQAYPRIHNA